MHPTRIPSSRWATLLTGIALATVLAGCSKRSSTAVADGPADLDRTTPLNLRGDGPTVGRKSRSVGTLAMTGGTLTATAGGQTERCTIDQRSEFEEEEEVLAVNGDRETKLRTRIVREQHTNTVRDGGPPDTHTETGSLVGREVESEFADGKWAHRLLGMAATAKQATDAANFPAPITVADFFPAGEVRPGVQKELDAKFLARHLGPNAKVESGSWRLTFVGSSTSNGVVTAHLQEQVEVTGTMTDPEHGTEHATIRVTGTTTLSLGKTRRQTTRWNGTMTSTRNVTEQGQRVEIRITGPISLEGTVQGID